MVAVVADTIITIMSVAPAVAEDMSTRSRIMVHVDAVVITEVVAAVTDLCTYKMVSEIKNLISD